MGLGRKLALRWILVGTTTNVYVAMASQILHFWGFIVITVTTSKYVQATVPEELKASGQLLLSVFGFGVARVIGYFGGGLLSDMLGRNTVFLICAGICTNRWRATDFKSVCAHRAKTATAPPQLSEVRLLMVFNIGIINELWKAN